MKNRSYPLYDVPALSDIPAMIREKAENNPDQVIFRFRKGRDGTGTKTYREVYTDVLRLASWMFRTHGSGRHFAVIGENSYEWLLAFFAALASGNVAVPVDKDLPAGEIAWMLRKAEVSVAFVSNTYEDQLSEAEGVETVTFRALKSLQGDRWEDFAFVSPVPESAACIFFTSGTSGCSKGVLLTHGNLASDVFLAARNVDLLGGPTVAVLPFHHAFGLVSAVLDSYFLNVEIFLNRSLKHVKEDLLLARPKVLFLVPLFVEVFHRQILDGIRKGGKEKKVRIGLRCINALLKAGIDIRRRLFREVLDAFGGDLQLIVCGGARLDPVYPKAFRDFGIDVLNGYGATECSPVIAVNRNHYQRDGSVGPALPGVGIRISGEGEVLIRGPIVMKEYYRDPEETALALRDGWYATGDLGYVDRDGFLFLTGRLKNLIILGNGENISPEELENDFGADPGVAAVMVCERDNSIVAEIFPQEGYLGNQAYFDTLMHKVNEGRPLYKQVTRVILRDQDFVRNTVRKIVRYKNMPAAKPEEE